MSVQEVQTTIAGREVSGEIVAREPTADYGRGPRDELVLDVDGSTWRVDEDDLDG
ncbi:hypothetical protein [Halosimplex pelagicum]|uniref:Uncharacterized protein n=1 Tax=Halosimplex pelagicum TaxID=869886 RepID=A0A7D5P4Z0_9EURY|nr:hypothetical protein [Halosimplex pelagicum]QLH80966.1 hypothetical protein HZS54_04645 [Halosimplex pelagicum]